MPLSTEDRLCHCHLKIACATVNWISLVPLSTEDRLCHCHLKIACATVNWRSLVPLSTEHCLCHCQLNIACATVKWRSLVPLSTEDCLCHCQLKIACATVNWTLLVPLSTEHCLCHCQLNIACATVKLTFIVPPSTAHSLHHCQPDSYAVTWVSPSEPWWLCHCSVKIPTLSLGVNSYYETEAVRSDNDTASDKWIFRISKSSVWLSWQRRSPTLGPCPAPSSLMRSSLMLGGILESFVGGLNITCLISTPWLLPFHSAQSVSELLFTSPMSWNFLKKKFLFLYMQCDNIASWRTMHCVRACICIVQGCGYACSVSADDPCHVTCCKFCSKQYNLIYLFLHRQKYSVPKYAVNKMLSPKCR